jgi:exodeoxyribonuclease VII small subunit
MTPPSQKKSTPAAERAPRGDEPVSEPIELAAELAGLSYEQARDALIDVVRRLEGGAETLEESLALWERGEALARHCEQWLEGAAARLDPGTTGPADD